MADELIEEGRQKGWVEGRARERAEGVVRILTTRGIAVDTDARQRILSCTDLDALDRWFERALKVASLSDVFASG
ncbi:hypothetical protein [Hyalangium minutum]|uniref:hypothetical protein n=1 Tax=Hyalangium minutum TaxID=394096 RepID=UPI001F0B0D45|nr:hypothetical protein [Hyalangium minutum]